VTHPAPSLFRSEEEWETWLDSALDNGVPAFRLAEFIKMLSMTAISPMAQVKFAWIRLKKLKCLIHEREAYHPNA
jgi:hypothetical protein